MSKSSNTKMSPAPMPSLAHTPPSKLTLNPLFRKQSCRTKARLLEEVPKLQRLAVKKVKGISTEELAARNDLVLALLDQIQAMSDGTATFKTGGWMSSAPSASRTEIKFDSGLRQVPLMDEIDTKVDAAAANLKNTNVRLKGAVT